MQWVPKWRPEVWCGRRSSSEQQVSRAEEQDGEDNQRKQQRSKDLFAFEFHL